jgi:hypothetical protein
VLYLEIFKLVSSKYVTFDLLRNRVDHVIDSSYWLRILRLWYFTFCRSHLQVESSYEVETENGYEQFEKVTVYAKPIVLGMRIKEYFYDRQWIYIPAVIILLLGCIYRILF